MLLYLLLFLVWGRSLEVLILKALVELRISLPDGLELRGLAQISLFLGGHRVGDVPSTHPRREARRRIAAGPPKCRVSAKDDGGDNDDGPSSPSSIVSRAKTTYTYTRKGYDEFWEIH